MALRELCSAQSAAAASGLAHSPLLVAAAVTDPSLSSASAPCTANPGSLVFACGRKGFTWLNLAAAYLSSKQRTEAFVSKQNGQNGHWDKT